ncbi:glycosyltransferase [Euzebya tangerina]|uniref:glycosyltransferase n=1 Tax=Euzebya tangerina TaxID=591198 RepID=UPI0013C2E117|nr:glycosyltransferase [Euzebya tangerina]
MSAAAPIRWSVVVPTKDRPAQICRLLDALTRLDPAPGSFEVIVVDDGSEQPYADRILEFAGLLDLRLEQQVNRGPAAARNTGLRASRGTWIAFTDDDCAPAPGWLMALDRCAAAHPDALLGGRCINVLADNDWSAASELIAESAEVATNFVTSNNAAAARQRLVDIGGFDEAFDGPAGEDRALAAAFVAAGGAIVRCPDAVVRHAHQLDLRGFWRQHQRFGRAAAALDDDAADARRMSASDRARMLRTAWRSGGAGLSARVVLSQAAVAVGVTRATVTRALDHVRQP